MKAKIQISSAGLLMIVLLLFCQSCGMHKTPLLHSLEEENHDEIVHLKDCPVVCKERTVFFEEHVYDASLSHCGYCGQKRAVQTAALK